MKNFDIYSLRNLEEHTSCPHYEHKDYSGFRFLKFEKGDVSKIEDVPVNCIFFVLEGDINVIVDGISHEILVSGHMICIGQHSNLTAMMLSQSRVVILLFDEPKNICEKQIFSSYLSYCEIDNFKLNVLPAISPLCDFFKSVELYLANKISCVHLGIIKEQEFFLILRYFYDKSEVANFL